MIISKLTLLHSEWPKLCRVLAVLSAIGLQQEVFYIVYFSHVRPMGRWLWEVLCNETPFKFWRVSHLQGDLNLQIPLSEVGSTTHLAMGVLRHLNDSGAKYRYLKRSSNTLQSLWIMSLWKWINQGIIMQQLLLFNTIALRRAETPLSFGRSECNRAK